MVYRCCKFILLLFVNIVLASLRPPPLLFKIDATCLLYIVPVLETISTLLHIFVILYLRSIGNIAFPIMAFGLTYPTEAASDATFCFKGPKMETSRGCRIWVVCGSKPMTWTSLAIAFLRRDSEIWESWLSKMRRTGLLLPQCGRKILLNHNSKISPTSLEESRP